MEIEEAVPQVRVVKKSDDPEGILRVSVGGVAAAGEGVPGYYVVYRGSKEEAVAGLRMALDAMEAVMRHLGPGKEPTVQPDDGKRYA